MSEAEPSSFWETREAVERFAARDPDVRLFGFLEGHADPSSVRILDLGCAAGRNTVPLAEAGFDVHAVDGSAAMVARTRDRLAGIVGRGEAERRVRTGRMDDLAEFPGGWFDLVAALGVLHQAGSGDEWRRAIGEVCRVLKNGGRFLYAGWSPASRPEGVPLQAVAGEPDVFLGFHTGRHYLLDAASLDAALASFGLTPEEPTAEVRVETERGERVTVNGLYRLG